jgi:hypothetical protein
MDTDILKKLIALANNNPNENEANAAARKVCKMLVDEKGNLLLGNSIPKINVREPQQYAYGPNPFQDRGYDYNDIFNRYWGQSRAYQQKTPKQQAQEYAKKRAEEQQYEAQYKAQQEAQQKAYEAQQKKYGHPYEGRTWHYDQTTDEWVNKLTKIRIARHLVDTLSYDQKQTMGFFD